MKKLFTTLFGVLFTIGVFGQYCKTTVDTLKVKYVILNDSCVSKLSNKILVRERKVFYFYNSKDSIIREIDWKIDNKNVDILFYKK